MLFNQAIAASREGVSADKSWLSPNERKYEAYKKIAKLYLRETNETDATN